jgi:tetratricopeptide (TPR) repeat protein
MHTQMQRKVLFQEAMTLRDQGKYKEAADLFLDLAKATDDLFEKAGMLLNLTHTLKASGSSGLAKTQLSAARELLSLPRNAALGNADEENRRRLLIWAELEDARISVAENGEEDAVNRLDGILANHQSELSKPAFAEIYQAVQRDRAFMLADLGCFQEALLILEEVDSADPHDRWTLFYLGHCYACAGRFVESQQRLEEAIRLGLTPDFEGRAHCVLGASCYEMGDYARAKVELENGAKTASPKYILQSGIWKWLEFTCTSLGLKAEAEHYRRLASSS